MLGIQIVGIVFVILMIYIIIRYGKKKILNSCECGFWIFFLSIILIVSLYPKVFTYITTLLNLNRVMDLIIFVGLIILFIFVFINYIAIKKLRKKFYDMIQNEAKQNNN